MLRAGAIATGGLLGLFHLWLLAGQLWRGQLADPDVAVRWLLAGGLLAGLIVWRRRQRLDARRVVAIAVLAALLHGPALADDHDGFALPAAPEAAVAVAQSALSLAALGLSLLALALLRAAPRAAAVSRSSTATPVAHRLPAGASRLGALPRPPPRC